MCGIVGFTGSRQAAPILLKGLSRLEYRGYDSAGIAVVHDGAIEVEKVSGRIAKLCEKTRDGAAVPGSGQELKVEYEGAELLGFGSAGSEHRSGFAHSECVFDGWNALAVLRKTAESGCAKVCCAGTEMSAEVPF